MTMPAVAPATPAPAAPAAPATPAPKFEDPGAQYDIDLTRPGADLPADDEEGDDEPADDDEETPAPAASTPPAPAADPAPLATPPGEPPAEPRMTYEEFQALEQRRQKEEADRQAAQRTEQEFQALIPASKKGVSDDLEALGAKYGITFTFADHQAMLRHVEALAEKGIEAGKALVGNSAAQAAEAKHTAFTNELTDVLYDAVGDANEQAFTDAVRGKGVKDWFQAAHDLAPPSPKVLQKQASALAEVAAAALPADAEWTAAFKAEAAKAKTPTDVIKAVMAASRQWGFHDPILEPIGSDGKGLGPRKTFAQLESGYGSGTLTDAEDREYTRLLAERNK